MDATRLLEHQHREAEKLFEKLSQDSKDRHPNQRAVAVELGRKLLAHMLIEQSIFYPAVKEVDEDAIHEAYEEHHIARGQIERMLATEVTEETFPAKVKALKELIEHHVKEEEKELFPKVRKLLGDARLAELGASMKREFDKLVERLPRALSSRAHAIDVLADVGD